MEVVELSVGSTLLCSKNVCSIFFIGESGFGLLLVPLFAVLMKKIEHTFFEHKSVDPTDNSTTSMSLHLLIAEQEQLEKMQAYSF
jgi:hypothetical protein